ncbi:Odorant receptor Or2 [Temnothorax longispinosus]|uniref:Odorant receptor Or2 n=1 Tax=Temnothorax longispinosus TaxID=300112 RepID=A0A4S2L570_9HYME|nr:Odorant receptor Or2 [Temnothorax longispinosus]
MKNVKKTDKFISIRLARFLMKVIGFWPAKSKTEERLLNGILTYTICMVVMALWIEATELYLGKGDFYVSTKICNVIINEEKLSLCGVVAFYCWHIKQRKSFFKCVILQLSALVHCGVCFCCFDNLLGLLNLHTAGQFKILQHQLGTILDRVERVGTVRSFDEKQRQGVYEKIKECVVVHHELIWYSEKMEQIFMYTTLCQLLVSGVMLCVAGFQVFLARGTLVRRLIFIAHTNGCFYQLFVVTLTANDLMDESRAVGDAAYNANWQVLSHEEDRKIRRAILMIMMRSARACSISAGGFFPVSLETFMAVNLT